MEILGNQLKNNKIFNAYIFESINKKYTLEKAIEFSEKIFNNYGVDIIGNENPDLDIINKDFDLKNIPITIIRDMIRDMYLRPYNGKIKIYIINDSQNLTLESSNALLKSIEDSKDYVVTIFTTNNSYNLLKTIRSRCQIISFESKNENESVDYDELCNILTGIIKGNLSIFYKNKEFFNKLKDKREDLFDQISVFFNNLLRYKYFSKDMIEDKNSIFYFKRIEDLPFDSIERIVKKIEEIKKGFKNNVNFDISVENFIFFIYREGKEFESSRNKL
ncbi:DNA polymerase III subunit delta' [Anaerococcus sp. AGMB00486]|uniref:DNA polymerase III subunit delta n=2 Tax=Anaerococcus TaxID=165779 RepID=A0ABX2N6Y0_9FIRM|nr:MULTISPECIES: DNA polymerase III subunit delta' [Anaerococcus]MSS77063.1 DNA polymerase III subunit delta' [Anaerococcus porci]NVF10447.1 DNA polymerase III subunit delta' [Anaerococcus faecalis]